MKIVVSYINSIYDQGTTIKIIAKCKDADGIHVDLMDGKYVPKKNFEITELAKLFSGIPKPLDIHLMTCKPSKYFSELFKLNPSAIYIHPKTEENPELVFDYLTKYNIDAGLVINPDEKVEEYEKYYDKVKRVLLMSVVPGAGGQTFIDSTTERLKKLISFKEKYGFLIYVDGGINDKTIKLVSDADGVVSGSYICESEDFTGRLRKLKKSINN